MKFTVRMFTTIAIAGILFAGCGGNNYMAEREFYKATKVLSQIDPSLGPEALTPALSAFKSVVEKYPGTPKALESLRIISNMSIRQKKYSDARDAMQSIVENYSGNKDVVPSARYRIAQIYELEGDWPAAQDAFWRVAEFSPLHAKGLYAPVRILAHYKAENDERGFEKQYVRALDHYEGLIKSIGPIDASVGPHNYLAMIYALKGDTDKAINTWVNITERFPKNNYAPMALLAAAEVAWRADQIERAEGLYGRYFTDYDKHPLAGKTCMNLGLQYHGRQDFKSARYWYQKALDEYFVDKSKERAEIQLLLAKSYQDEVMWDEANALYTEIETDYEGSVPALQIPLLRANHYSGTGDTEKSDEILNQAIAEYDAIESESGDKNMTALVKRFRAAALAQKGDWDEVVSNVDAQFAAAEDPERKGKWLFLKALLTQNRLQNDVMARALFEKFIRDYPDHPLVPRARKQLESIAEPEAVPTSMASSLAS